MKYISISALSSIEMIGNGFPARLKVAKMNGVFTGISGKVGNTVFCHNNGKQIIKTGYGPSGLPSSGQTADRSIFSQVIDNFKILSTSFLPRFFTRSTRAGLSDWQRLVSFVKSSMGSSYSLLDTTIIDGRLENLGFVRAGFSTADDEIEISWSAYPISNGWSDDSVNCIIFDSNTGKFVQEYYDVADRDDGHVRLSYLQSFPYTDLVCMVWASRYNSAGTKVLSNSINLNTTVDLYLIAMQFEDTGGVVCNLRCNPVGVAVIADWTGRGNFQTISTSSQTSSNVIPSSISLYAQNGFLFWFLSSSNFFSFNLSSLPSDLTYFNCTGSNTITGNLSSLPSDLTLFICGGSNTITGNLSSLPSDLYFLYCTGSNTISDYTALHTFAENFQYMLSLPAAGSGLDSTEVDNLLIDLAKITTWAGAKVIDIAGNNAARTGASDAAVTDLQAKGVTVTVNE